jgi:hypothetical protein
MLGLSVLPLSQAHTVRVPDQTVPLADTPEFIFLAVAVAVILYFFVLRQRPRGERSRSQGKRPPGRGSRPAPRGKVLRPRRDRNWILVDGSNVMHWEDNTPHIEPVRRVVAALKAQGLDPGVVFDANVGWKLFGRYLGEQELSQILDLPADQVLVVPKGNPADPWLLTTARDFSARIVTNDRFRDWAEAHPEVDRPGFLVRGSLSGSGVWLEGMQGPVDNSGA